MFSNHARLTPEILYPAQWAEARVREPRVETAQDGGKSHDPYFYPAQDGGQQHPMPRICTPPGTAANHNKCNGHGRAHHVRPARDGGKPTNHGPKHKTVQWHCRAHQFMPRPGRRHSTNVNQQTTQKCDGNTSQDTQRKAGNRARTGRTHARKGPRKPRTDTKADESTKSREQTTRSESWKKCLANPLREDRMCTKLEIATTKKNTDSTSFSWRPPRIAPH